MDNKNIGLSKNLLWLRQELDVYCLITVNRESIIKKGAGKTFFAFLQEACKKLIALSICKIYEYEKQYEIDQERLRKFSGGIKKQETNHS